MANIAFTQQQLDTLSSITSGGTADFYLGYDYLNYLLSSLTPAEIATMGVTQDEVDERIYWLGKASAINQNDLSNAANNFIRDVTRYGLLWDGEAVGNIQKNSDAIGASVIQKLINEGEFLPIAAIVGSDVQAAIEDGGQTIAGWGGAFYYWNAPYAPGGAGATVGSTILADTNQLEKFISLASCATYNALCRGAATTVGGVLDMLWAGGASQVPLTIKYQIGDRVTDYLTGARTHFSDNPLSWEWEKSLDFSNAAGGSQAGQHGLDINLITGWVHGIEYSHEDFQTFFKIESVVGSNLGDIITLDGTLPLVEIQAGSGDDKIYATGGTVMATGGGGDDLFSTNSYSTEVDFARHGETLTIEGTTATFTYVLENFDWVQFYDVTVSFEDLLNDIEQLIMGTPGVDALDGTSRKDLIKGFASNDVINASGGDDRIYGGAGNDVIDGGSGTDKAYYSGNIADYDIGIVGSNIVLTDTVANRDGVDTLTGIEELFFDDGSIIVANLPKAPTSFQVSYANVHTHIGMVAGSQFYAAALTNIVDADGGVNLMEIDASRTDATILPYLVINSYGKLSFNGIAPAGMFDIGLRTYDAANNVRSETQVVAVEVHENVAPTGVAWDMDRAGNAGSIFEGPAANTLVGYIRVVDENGQRAGGSGENYSIKLLGDYAHTYRLVDDGDIIPGSHEHYHKVIVLDPDNVDYEYDSSPDLQLEITDIAGNVETFTLHVNVQNVANTNWKELTAGTTGQIRNKAGTNQDDTLDASVSNGTYNLTGGAGGDTLIGGKGADKIDGGVGNDTMRGNGGNDDLYALSGSDTVYGGTGSDTVHLGSSLRPEFVDSAYMDGNFLVIENDDTVVRIYSDVESIHIAAWGVGDLYYSRTEYLSMV